VLIVQAAVPSLVASVKDAGLLLATFGSVEDVGKLRTGTADGRTVDAFVIDGYVYSLVSYPHVINIDAQYHDPHYIDRL
jgi:hypothetical protein